MLAPSELAAELARHPHLAALCARTRAVAAAAFSQNRPQLLYGEEVADLSGTELPAVAQADAETPFGNVLEVLDRGPKNEAEWALLGALWAHATATSPSDADVSTALWLSTETPLAAALYADVVWPTSARENLWAAVAAGSTNPLCTPKERIALAALLAVAESEQARAAAITATETAADPVVSKLLLPIVLARKPLVGELSLGRGPVQTTLLALSGLLFVLGALRFLARFVLGLRRRATLVLHADGVAVSQSTLLLGKPLRTTERFLPMGQIARIERETRYAGLALYAGLFCLALGSYLGIGLVTDSVRAPGGSPSLLGIGLLVIAAGVLLDFLLFRLSGLRRGKARLTIAPNKGRALLLSGAEVPRADAWVRAVGNPKSA